MHHLTARQRRHIITTLRDELDRFGGLPGLHKRHRARVAHRLAELYGIPAKDVLGMWERHVAARRQAALERNAALFAARVAAGTTSTVPIATFR